MRGSASTQGSEGRGGKTANLGEAPRHDLSTVRHILREGEGSKRGDGGHSGGQRARAPSLLSRHI
ncbi:hypothetical protein E2C01_005959 [Portunus trituberculatus]|uniref:Uncharacterized protein n=1 Tax=Portunus trituberculatus TaxID=210409 RepID=A0A5B7CWU7_PORTR|nr:hypothetical protein [Portunus trituberculatus]